MDAEGRAETLQEVFDITYRMLRDRNWAKAMDKDDKDDEDSGMCMYRSPVGPCAAGIHILDSEYTPRMEEKIFVSIMELAPKLVEWVNKLDALWLINAMQEAHDFSREGNMEKRFQDLAVKANLLIPG